MTIIQHEAHDGTKDTKFNGTDLRGHRIIVVFADNSFVAQLDGARAR